MLKHGDPKIRAHMAKVRALEKEYPDRSWKSGLTKEQISEMEKLRAEHLQNDLE